MKGWWSAYKLCMSAKTNNICVFSYLQQEFSLIEHTAWGLENRLIIISCCYASTFHLSFLSSLMLNYTFRPFSVLCCWSPLDSLTAWVRRGDYGVGCCYSGSISQRLSPLLDSIGNALPCQDHIFVPSKFELT